MKKSFKEIKSIILMRKLFFFLVKLGFSIFSILFITLFTLLIVLSTKPRTITPINNIILSQLNKSDKVSIKFNPQEATFQFDYGFNLKYKIKEISVTYQDNNLKIKNFTIDIDIVKLLFKQIEIKNISLPDSELELDLESFKKNDQINNNKKEILEEYNNLMHKIQNKIFIVKKFSLKDLHVKIKNGENNETILDIINYSLNINFKNNNLVTNQHILYNINNSKINSRLTINCFNEDNNKQCKILIDNINPHNYINLVQKTSPIYTYLYNIIGYFDAKLSVVFDKEFNIENGNFEMKSLLGTFDLREFFDEKITFTLLKLNGNFDLKLKKFSLQSLTTKFDKVDFGMSMLIEDKPDFMSMDLSFDAKNVPLIRLKQLWPSNLGEENARPWVLEHIKGGTSPEAFAKMNLKYFKDKKRIKDSGLQNIYSEVKINKAVLNYDNYFPKITELDGLAVFTENYMDIAINNGKVLSSKVNNGNVHIDFTKKISDVVIKANILGPFSDLFVHIDKKDKKIIENAVNSAIEDYYTNSNVKLIIPLIENIDFKSVYIGAQSNLLNKTNSLISNSDQIKLSFVKNLNSNHFGGEIDLTKSALTFIPLNIYKEKDKALLFSYECSLKDNKISIIKLQPKVDYLSFDIDGFFDTSTKEQEININNIAYNGSNYNINFKSHMEQNIPYNDVTITGKNINYKNIAKILQNLNISNNASKNSINEFKINLALDYLSFDKNNKLYNPLLSLHLKNDKLTNLNFSATMPNQKIVTVESFKEDNSLEIYSNDFGELLQIIELTSIIRGGDGYLTLSRKKIDNKDHLKLDIEITKKMTILTNDSVKQEVLTDIEKESKFKNLKKNIKKESGVNLNKLKGEVFYRDGVMDLNKIVASSEFINLDIVASGIINLQTEEIKINGLLIPLGFVNSLFGASKLPVVGKIVFGEQDGGLFASKFKIIKEDSNSKLDVDIDKFSMIIPGFLRNILNSSILDFNYFNFFKNNR